MYDRLLRTSRSPRQHHWPQSPQYWQTPPTQHGDGSALLAIIARQVSLTDDLTHNDRHAPPSCLRLDWPVHKLPLTRVHRRQSPIPFCLVWRRQSARWHLPHLETHVRRAPCDWEMESRERSNLSRWPLLHNQSSARCSARYTVVRYPW